MKLSHTKTVDGVTYTLTQDRSLTGGIDDYTWRALDGTGKILDVTQDEFDRYELS